MKLRMAAVLGLLAIAIASCSSQEGPAGLDGLVDVGTHRLHAVVAGSGSPVVVIDGGIGAGAEEYRALQAGVAERTTVVAYDRAGYGQSEAGPLPRDSAREADELLALLTALELPGPYVLVGHSLGGLNAEVLAARHPGEVAGMVLLDPPPLGWLLGEEFGELLGMADGMTAEWQAAADRGVESADAGERAQALFMQALASEHREMPGESARLAAEVETFGDTPLVVIASGVPNPMFGPAAVAYQEYWIEQSRALAARSARGVFVLAEDSTHRLHVDVADLVLANVLSVVEDVRTSR